MFPTEESGTNLWSSSRSIVWVSGAILLSDFRNILFDDIHTYMGKLERKEEGGWEK